MSGHDKRRRSIWAAWVMTLGAFGCLDEREVSIGEGDAVALDVCTGVNTRCVAQEAVPLPALTGVRQCTGELTGTLVPVFEIDLQTKLCVPDPESQPVCTLTWMSNAVGPDGSLWVIAGYQYALFEGSAPGVWLGHYTQDGRELGARTIVSVQSLDVKARNYSASVAALPNGNATVLIHMETEDERGLDERTWLETFSSDALPNGNSALLEIGAADMVSTAQGTLIVAGDPLGGAKRGILAAIAGGQVMWSQTQVPSAGTKGSWGVTGVVVDGAGSTRVMSIHDSDRAAGMESHGLARFDADGNLVWNRIVASVRGASTATPLAVDAMGNTSILVREFGDVPRKSTVISVGPDGAPRFAYSFGIVSLGLAVAHDSGRIYVDGAPGEVHEIAADGTTCRTYSSTAEPKLRTPPSIVVGDSMYGVSGRYRLVPNE